MSPPKGRPLNQQKQDERKQLLLDAAYSLLQEKSYRTITIRDLADRAGMRSGMISYYFGNKEGLFIALLESKSANNFQQIRVAVQSDNPIRAFIKSAIKDFSENNALSTFIADEILSHEGALRDKFIDLMPKRMAGFLPELVKQQQQAGRIREDLDPKWVAFSLTNMIVMPFIGAPVRERAWDISKETLASEAWIEHIYQMFMSGCGTANQKPNSNLSDTQTR